MGHRREEACQVMRLAKLWGLLNMAWIDSCWSCWTVGIWTTLQLNSSKSASWLMKIYVIYVPCTNLVTMVPGFQGDPIIPKIIPNTSGSIARLILRCEIPHFVLDRRLPRESIWQHYFGASQTSQGSRMGSSCYKHRCEGFLSQKTETRITTSMTFLFSFFL